ncbi:MAG TPA: transporter [Burkholderiales bacterium]|nr:transporter [Burkholderiales bacterium]
MCRTGTRTACALIAAALAVIATRSQAQELEPRAYSASPVGTNFVVAGWTRLRGEVLTDPALPIKNVQADIDVYVAGYARTFELAGRTASAAAVLPFARGEVSGDVFDASREVHRSGIGDARLRLALNLYGNPAMTPREFAQRPPGLVVGTSVSMVVPTGQYVPERLVNVGTHRWAFKPEVGFSYPVGNWFFEASAGAWLYTDNDNFFGGKHRSQDPLYVTQVHAGYNFRPGLWLAVNAAHNSGGRTTIDGVGSNDRQNNSRYGATLSVPFTAGWSAKLAWSKGAQIRAGGDYDVIAVALQYRWFDK